MDKGRIVKLLEDELELEWPFKRSIVLAIRALKQGSANIYIGEPVTELLEHLAKSYLSISLEKVAREKLVARGKAFVAAAEELRLQTVGT